MLFFSLSSLFFTTAHTLSNQQRKCQNPCPVWQLQLGSAWQLGRLIKMSLQLKSRGEIFGASHVHRGNVQWDCIWNNDSLQPQGTNFIFFFTDSLNAIQTRQPDFPMFQSLFGLKYQVNFARSLQRSYYPLFSSFQTATNKQIREHEEHAAFVIAAFCLNLF